jgi:moderate conductance mechanosensitive channel
MPGADRLKDVRVVARTLPGKQFKVGRELRARVALALQTEGINVSTELDTDAVEPVGAS